MASRSRPTRARARTTDRDARGDECDAAAAGASAATDDRRPVVVFYIGHIDMVYAVCVV
jgi:hypothetical protein